MSRYQSQLTYRRLRANAYVRELTARVSVSHRQMIQPLFVTEGLTAREIIPGLTGTHRDTPTSLVQQVESDLKNGIHKFLLFVSPTAKHTHGFDHRFLTSQITALKQQFGDDIWLAADICLCASTTHGHCGVLNDAMDHVLNPESTDALAQMALAAAEAGADCVAPSDMMDGRIRATREILDNNNHAETVLMSYSAKFASAFYGPFRIAQNSTPDKKIKLQDRKTYQMDYRRPDDALACSLRDAAEGADILMVKPVVHYLDVLKELTTQITLPFAAYYVSGEHALVEAAAAQGLVDARAAHIENWHGIARAGGQIIITYAARYAREWLEDFYGK
jgi:porphobilinogen synthase